MAASAMIDEASSRPDAVTEGHAVTESRTRDRTIQSDAIAIGRLIGILGIVYVHSWLRSSMGEIKAAPAGIYAIYWGIGEFFGRGSTPLLAVISGWLAGPSLKKRLYPRFVRDKAQTLVLPAVLWFVPSIPFIFMLQHTGSQPVWTAGDYVNELFALTGMPPIVSTAPAARAIRNAGG